MLGKKSLLGSEIPYECDDQVQLVCKYLKAMKTNTLDQVLKGIRIITIVKLCYRLQLIGSIEEIRIGAMDKVTPEDCCSLLNEYMPPQVRLRKISQKLYVR